MTEGYILVAIGKKYIDECYNLALTLKKNKDNRPISLLIKSEDEEYAVFKNIFDKLYLFDDKHQIFLDCKTSFEKYGVYPKITLDKYLPYDASIFLDSDVLCIYNTDTVWELFNNNSQSVQCIDLEKDPSWHFGKLENVSKIYGKNIPHTHSGILYMRKNQELYDFFNYCRETFYKHDEYGCSREFRGGIADEILFAISFAKFNYLPHNFIKNGIMTFNLTSFEKLPTKKQTGSDILYTSDDYIPFVHMMDKQVGPNYQAIFRQILNKE